MTQVATPSQVSQDPLAVSATTSRGNASGDVRGDGRGRGATGYLRGGPETSHSPESALAGKGWQASLSLNFYRSRHRTIVQRHHEGPLRIQRPFYPERDLCHVYLLHPPGGVVSGDALSVDVTVNEQAAGLITTPGAGRFYRSGGAHGTLTQTLNVNGGSLEWFPVETLLFNEALVRITTRINLYGTARFIGWDIQCYGRPAAKETFTTGEVSNRVEIYREGLPVLLERTLINSQHTLSRQTGHRGYDTQGLFIVTLDQTLLLDTVQQYCHAVEGACVTHVDGLLLVRYLGHSVDQARALFTDLWQLLRPVVNGRKVTLPRIWAT